MHANEIEALKPGPGLALAEVPATVEAVREIQEAHALLEPSRAAVMRANQARRNEARLGVDAAGEEIAAWNRWQGTTLRQFHEVRHAAAVKALAACESAVTTDAVEIAEREKGIARGLGGLLHDQGAGADVALLLKRVTGGLPINVELHACRDRWRNVAETSRRALVGLPRAPVQMPSASEVTNELKTMLTEKEG